MLNVRDLVRVGATGALAPAEIWQRMAGTHPEKGAILQNNTKCSKTSEGAWRSQRPLGWPTSIKDAKILTYINIMYE